MTRNRILASVLGAFAATGIGAAPLFAQTTEAHIQELIRAAAERIGTGQAVLADPLQTGAQSSGNVVQMSLDDAVKLALDRNLDIAVQKLNPRISDIAVASVRSAYHPSLTSMVSQSATNGTPTSQLQLSSGGGGTNTENLAYNGGIAQSLPWGGGSFQVTLNNGRNITNSNNALFNPQFNSVWTGVFVQPLLRNFRTDSTRQQLQVTQINREISDVQLRATIMNTLSNVRNAYWDYVYTTQAVEVAQQSLDLATKLVQDNQTRVEIGTMAPIDVVQAQSEQATRRQALVTAQSAKRTAELALKRLIVLGTEDPNWKADLDPIDRPDFRPEPIDLEAAIRNALSARTDLEIAKKNMLSNDVTLRFLQDQMKPQADLQAQYGVAGVGGPNLVRSNTGVLGSQVTTINPGGIADAFSTLLRNQYPRWTVQLNVSYPLGASSQEAAVARARVQLNQVQAQMKQIELQVATDVTNAAINARNTAEAVQAAQAARELADKKLEAEQSKFEVGMSTNYFVVQAQRDLSDARNSELRAVLNYRKSLVELERLQQTTPQNLNITLLNAGGGATTTIRQTGGGGQGGGQ